MSRTHTWGAAAAVLLLALAGCSAGGASLPAGDVAAATAEDASRAGEYTQEDSAAAMPEAKPADGSVLTGQQKIARTARISITVTDVDAAAAQLRQLSLAMGGLVTSENLVTKPGEAEDQPVSTMVISVPADKLDSTLDQLRSVGSITNRVISSEDVTTQVADVDARIKTLDASIARLRELSDKAGSIRELTELEAELTNRSSERDSLTAQQKVLAGRVAQSPITITLSTPDDVQEPEPEGFLGGLIAGWNALVTSSGVLMMVVGAVLPFAALAALIATPFLIWRRRRTRSVASVGADRARQDEADDDASSGVPHRGD